MKTMKNFLSMAALALVGAMMTGCSSDDDILQSENKTNVVTQTATVGFDDGVAATRAVTGTGVKTFGAGDQMAVIYKNTSGGTVKAVGTLTSGAGTKSGTFTFTLTNPDKTQNVTYIYPAAMAGSTGVDYTKLNSQSSGTLTDLGSKYDLATNSGAWNGENLPTLTLENQLAILAITLKDNAATPSEITNGITDMTVSDGTNTYTVSRSAAAGPIYVAIRPTTSANIKIYASDGSNYYNKNLTGKTYAAGNGYSVSWKMPEALISNATTADYGMAVCDKGHLHLAKTAVPSGCTAIGIVGKVTETGHGLILALQDAPSQTWYTINGWDSRDNFAGTTLKLLPDGAHGSLTSYLILWHNLSDPIVVSNWCVAQKSDYEAIFTNLGSTTYLNGMTYDNNVEAYITTGVGGTAMDDTYWSATEYEYDNLCAWFFCRGYWIGHTSGVKSNSCSVRPVLGF